MKYFLIQILCGLLVWGYGGMTFAEKAADPWDLFEPPPDTKFDWIQLTSGEWLKGDLKVMYDFTLEFDSDEMDLQELDFEDVRQIRTRNPQKVLVETDSHETEIITGVLVMKEDKVMLRKTSGDEIELHRDKVISIAERADREWDRWSGMLSIGLNLRGGNSDTADLTTTAKIQRRTVLTRFGADYLANYSQSQEVETANNQRLNGNFDWFLTSRFFWQILGGEYYRDPFSNIDSQYSLHTGFGYDLIHSQKTEWTVSAGVGYQQTRFSSVEAGQDDQSSSPFLGAETVFDYEISGYIDYLFDYSLRWLNESNGQYTHHMLTTLSFDLISDLDFDVSLIWDRIEKPQAAADGSVPKQDDYQLVFGLAYDF
jgi:hypothetical protein